MSEQNNRYKNAMNRLEEILTKIDQSDVSVDELASQVEEPFAHFFPYPKEWFCIPEEVG